MKNAKNARSMLNPSYPKAHTWEEAVPLFSHNYKPLKSARRGRRKLKKTLKMKKEVEK
jgi:hypothetical protein